MVLLRVREAKKSVIIMGLMGVMVVSAAQAASGQPPQLQVLKASHATQQGLSLVTSTKQTEQKDWPTEQARVGQRPD